MGAISSIPIYRRAGYSGSRAEFDSWEAISEPVLGPTPPPPTSRYTNAEYGQTSPMTDDTLWGEDAAFRSGLAKVWKCLVFLTLKFPLCIYTSGTCESGKRHVITHGPGSTTQFMGLVVGRMALALGTIRKPCHPSPTTHSCQEQSRRQHWSKRKLLNTWAAARVCSRKNSAHRRFRLELPLANATRKIGYRQKP